MTDYTTTFLFHSFIFICRRGPTQRGHFFIVTGPYMIFGSKLSVENTVITATTRRDCDYDDDDEDSQLVATTGSESRDSRVASRESHNSRVGSFLFELGNLFFLFEVGSLGWLGEVGSLGTVGRCFPPKAVPVFTLQY